MAGDADLAAVGALLSDRTRATILLTLLNGGMTSASALAGRADVSRPLASAHLRKLTEGGLITVEPHGPPPFPPPLKPARPRRARVADPALAGERRHLAARLEGEHRPAARAPLL